MSNTCNEPHYIQLPCLLFRSWSTGLESEWLRVITSPWISLSGDRDLLRRRVLQNRFGLRMLWGTIVGEGVLRIQSDSDNWRCGNREKSMIG